MFGNLSRSKMKQITQVKFLIDKKYDNQTKERERE